MREQGAARKLEHRLRHFFREVFLRDRGIQKKSLLLGWKETFLIKLLMKLITLNSSQGNAMRIIHLSVLLCRMPRITGNSSILFLLLFSLCFHGDLWATSSTLAGITGQHEQQAREQEYRAVGDSFEAMMLSHFYRQLRESSRMVNMGDDNPFAPSNAQLVFESMRDDALMEDLALRRPLGISDLVVEQLKGYNR